jgi:hypothetical protein
VRAVGAAWLALTGSRGLVQALANAASPSVPI